MHWQHELSDIRVLAEDSGHDLNGQIFIPWRGLIYAVGMNIKTGIHIAWYTPIAAAQCNLVASIYKVEFIVVACDHELSFNKMTSSVIIHIHIG